MSVLYGEKQKAVDPPLHLPVPVVITPDPGDLVIPELAVVSDILRTRFEAKGDSLPIAALDINDRFAQESGFSSGFNKDSLNRALWAGYTKGLKSINLALPAFYFLSRFYNVDGAKLVKRMGEEKLRRDLFARLAAQNISVDDFVSPLYQILKFEEVATLTGWLSGTGYTGNLNNYYEALALACKRVGIDFNAKQMRNLVNSVAD
jgi:hypothetical protein